MWQGLALKGSVLLFIAEIEMKIYKELVLGYKFSQTIFVFNLLS